MERAETRIDNGHAIDIVTRASDPSINNSSSQSHRETKTPYNSVFWISYKLVITMSQLTAAIVVLFISKHEHPNAHFFPWMISYVSGCVATLPLICWRFYYRKVASGLDLSHPRLKSAPNIVSATDTSLTSSSNVSTCAVYTKLRGVVAYYAGGLDGFFLVWLFVGDQWNFCGPSSASDAPKLYRFCLVFIYITTTVNVMPFFCFAILLCVHPCIVHVLGLNDLSENGGATRESINSLPTYKFRINNHGNNSGPYQAGVLSGEDAVCRICFAKYANNDILRQLLCTHYDENSEAVAEQVPKPRVWKVYSRRAKQSFNNSG